MGESIQVLLSKLRQQRCQAGPTPYLDTVLAAFTQQFQVEKSQSKQEEERITAQPPFGSLSKRELEVLHALASGASNHQIAQELIITVDTVKRHVSHILYKFGAQNRVQVIKQAESLGILDEP
jgi:LuxR family maltose regulon positive regulatory protein